MAIIRTDRTRVLYAVEDVWGVRPNTPTWRAFGLLETLDVPDPDQGWQSFYGVGTSRNRGTILRGPWDLRGNVPDIRLVSSLAGQVLSLPIGRVVGATVFEGRSSTDERLNSFSLQVAAQDTDGAYSFIREYYGGKVGRFSLRASEGQDVRVSLEDIIFKDMAHNLIGVSKYSSSVVEGTLPTYEPDRFLFSGGTLTFFGTVLARVKSLSITLDNQLEPRRYISKATADATGLSQTINDLIEGKRIYSMQVEVDVADPSTDLELFKYLMNQSGPSGGQSTGGQVTLNFALMTGEGSGSLIITAGGASTASSPGVVVRGGRINVPAPPTGLFSGTYTLDVDTISVSVPV